jgi:hypothetical protein
MRWNGASLSVTMRDFDQERWVQLYTAAMLEMRYSLLPGRIQDARSEILKRNEQLREIIVDHQDEFQALSDALSGLKGLEKEADAQRSPTTKRQESEFPESE